MGLTSSKTELDGVLVLEPTVHGDSRGFFLELWHACRYREVGVPDTFVQDNLSKSTKMTLRGLHVQEPFGQGKLIQVLDGEVFDVAVDVRVGSPTFGRWVSATLSSENHQQIYVPPGFAHGFCVLSESVLLTYKCTELYHPETELTIAWNDPALAIAWPITQPNLSKKDANAPRLAEIARDRLPQWQAAP